jgi:hypothetical protein
LFEDELRASSARHFDVMDGEMRQHKGLLRRRKCSENTIRRRVATYRLFRRIVDEDD